MPTTEELQDAKQRKADLARYGISWEPTYTPAPTAQWYRADGTALPNLLPADPYHIRRYEARGWTMFPPVAPTSPAPVPDLNETAAADVEEAAWEIGHRGGISLATSEAKPVRKHVHAYNQQMGSPCKVSGCGAVRTTPFVKRGKKKP